MKKHARKKNKRAKRYAEQGAFEAPTAEQLVAYGPVRIPPERCFDLERQALQEILDAVLKLQTYIAMRERRG